MDTARMHAYEITNVLCPLEPPFPALHPKISGDLLAPLNAMTIAPHSAQARCDRPYPVTRHDRVIWSDRYHREP